MTRMGRPKADAVDRLRARVWYLAVKARDGWSDYRLDLEFARNTDDPVPTGPARIRAFEGIRRNGTVPSAGSHRRRSFDLVERVEGHPLFKGTADYFRSPFWDLLKSGPIGISDIQPFVQRLMASCGICRPSLVVHHLFAARKLEQELALPNTSRSEVAAIYDAQLARLITSLPLHLDVLAMLGGLFREAYLVGALEIAAVLAGHVHDFIKRFSAQGWLDQETSDTLVDLGERRLLNWQMGAHFDGDNYYDDWPPSVVERPLHCLNSEMRHAISNEDNLLKHFKSR
ncbi:MAG: hypothetical protein OEL88_11740 [Sterolibacteriaceae bacterium MAG5]|nr:hypothetical protein [Candidatus Nitricoxidireducens bremensis]